MSKKHVVMHGITHRRTNRYIKLGTRRKKLDMQNLKYNQLPCSLMECDNLKLALLLDSVSNFLSDFRFSQW
jgi:hypothetical protein